MERGAPSWRIAATAAAAALVLTTRPTHGWMSSSVPLSSSGYGSTSTSSAWTSRSRVMQRARARDRPVRNVGVRMQVWSNPQAVKEYQELLDGNAPDEAADGPSVIIGAGKIGTALASMGMGEDVILGRGEGIPDTIPASSGKGEDGDGLLKEFPIYVCVPESEVAGVIDSCPPDKRYDLVFLQSGCLEPLLKSRGLCRPEQTQATLYIGVKQVGARPKDFMSDIGTDTRGDVKLAGETAACGKWRGALAMRLGRSEYALHCSPVFYLDWRRVMFEKLIFECAVNLVGALHEFKSVGYITQYHSEEVCDMLFELKNALRGTLAVSLMNGYPERLLAYGDEVGDSKLTRMDEETFLWHNKFFLDISNTAKKNKFDDPCPMHTEYLEYGREKGIFTF